MPKWNESLLEEIRSLNLKSYNLAAGFKPSGPMHIGTLREIALVEYMSWGIERFLEAKGRKYLFIDDIDPLKKIPQSGNLEEEALETCLYKLPELYPKFKAKGNSLTREIDMVAKYFNVEVVWISKLYNSGEMNEQIAEVYRQRQRLSREIKSKLSLDTNFLPLVPIDKETYKYVKTPGRYIKESFQTEEKGYSIYDGNSKLAWKVGGAARWAMFQIDFEPYGKDHLESSIEATKWISREIFKRRPPVELSYEFILDEDNSKLSKSKGSFTLDEVFKSTPLGNLKHFLLTKPKSTIIYSEKKLILNVNKIIDEVVAGSKTDQKAFSSLPFIFENQVPNLNEKLYFLELSKIFTYIYPFGRIENFGSILDLIIKFKIEGIDLNCRYVRELIESYFVYWLKVIKRFKVVKELTDYESRILQDFVETLKENVSENYLNNYVKKSSTLRRLGYSILAMNEQGGIKILDTFEIFGRSRIINLLELVGSSRFYLNFQWQEFKKEITQ